MYGISALSHELLNSVNRNPKVDRPLVDKPSGCDLGFQGFDGGPDRRGRSGIAYESVWQFAACATVPSQLEGPIAAANRYSRSINSCGAN
jgi:hypothetical protein